LKSRKHRADSTAEAVRIMREAHKEIVPPANIPLDDGDWPFFANIVEEFARADWTPHQLELAALLARSMHDFTVEQMMLRDEGAVVQGDKGLVPNPRKVVLQMHSNNIVAFRRTLAMHAATRGETKDIGKNLAIGRSVQQQNPFGDELIARA
jgi:hypothetical protein